MCEGRLGGCGEEEEEEAERVCDMYCIFSSH